MGIYMNTHWFKVFLVSLLLTICIVGGIFLTMQKVESKKNTALELQNFETKILDEHKQKLTEQGYEEVSYELNKIIQEMQKNNIVYRPSVNLNNSIEDTVIKKYDFYAIYYKITIDDKDYIFKNKEKCEEFINNIQQYTSQKYEMATTRLMVNKETSDEDLTNIIADKKAAYEKAKAEEEARKKAEQEAAAARKKQQQQQQQQNVSPAQTGSKAEYQQYAHDLVINTYGWSEYDFQCLVNLWERESGWNPNSHNSSSGAHGIPQALPASKMASEGSDYYTNGYTQIRWGLKYIKGRYGSPANAWSHFQSKNWY
jgi:hypothetical protein